HGNSLRGIVKNLKNLSDDEVVDLNLPTAVPYVFEFDRRLDLVRDYFLGDADRIARSMAAVAAQGRAE
ncbi:MAG: 2,3-diphosphoglycerate-dependent phosphoglycerate mutase, partial [Alistipes sp.]|nr:2,3-diphosphoglycerate-dependent phosphoglycerate mutase [Alistipes sp.]